MSKRYTIVKESGKTYVYDNVKEQMSVNDGSDKLLENVSGNLNQLFKFVNPDSVEDSNRNPFEQVILKDPLSK